MDKYINQRRVRVLAKRAPNIVERHAGQHAVLEAMRETVKTGCKAYLESDEAVHRQRGVAREKVDAANANVDSLRGLLRSWDGMLMNDVPGHGVDDGSLADINVPSLLFVETSRAIGLVRERGEALPWGSTFLAAVEPAVQRAEEAQEAAQDELATLQSMQSEARSKAASLAPVLAALTRTLRVLLGSRHRDYRSMRARRGHPADDEDDTNDAAAVSSSPADGIAVSTGSSGGDSGNGVAPAVSAART